MRPEKFDQHGCARERVRAECFSLVIDSSEIRHAVAHFDGIGCNLLFTDGNGRGQERAHDKSKRRRDTAIPACTHHESSDTKQRTEQKDRNKQGAVCRDRNLIREVKPVGRGQNSDTEGKPSQRGSQLLVFLDHVNTLFFGATLAISIQRSKSRYNPQLFNDSEGKHSMSNRINGQWRLKSRPVGMVKETDFEYIEAPLPDLGENEFLIRNLYFAFEPAMRGWLNDVKSYVPPVQLGEVMRASAVGQVVESNNADFQPGEFVSGMFGWQEYAINNGQPGVMGRIAKVPDGVPPYLVLSALGGTGLTAYFGLLDIGKPKAGDVVVVSGAAGATGSVAGQIARIKGAAKVVGIAGGPEKCDWLTSELGFDAAIDYKSEDVQARLAQECPSGIDIFFDNVGGDILDAALLNMAMNGRIVLCGGISSYNEEELPPGPKNYMQLVIRRCTMQGFILIDYFDQAAEASKMLAGWIASGELKHGEDIQEGIENTPRTFLRLFEGKNTGKQLLKISEPPLS